MNKQKVHSETLRNILLFYMNKKGVSWDKLVSWHDEKKVYSFQVADSANIFLRVLEEEGMDLSALGFYDTATTHITERGNPVCFSCGMEVVVEGFDKDAYLKELKEADYFWGAKHSCSDCRDIWSDSHFQFNVMGTNMNYRRKKARQMKFVMMEDRARKKGRKKAGK